MHSEIQECKSSPPARADGPSQEKTDDVDPPPFDPEVAAALAAMGGAAPPSVTPEMIPALREQYMAVLPSDEQIAGTTFDVCERLMPPGPRTHPTSPYSLCGPPVRRDPGPSATKPTPPPSTSSPAPHSQFPLP